MMETQTTRETNSKKPANWRARPAMETKPPKFLLKVMNPFMRRMVRGGGGKMGDMIMLITFKGRKSGKTFTTPLGYTRKGNSITCFTDSPWWKNLEGGAPVKLTIKGQEMQGFATPVSDKAQVLEYVSGRLREGGPQAVRQMALSLPKGYTPTDDELRIMLRDRVLIEIQLQGST